MNIFLLFLYCGESIAAPVVEFNRRGTDAVATVNEREEPSATKTDNGPTMTATGATTTTDAKETKDVKTTTAAIAHTGSSTTSDATPIATTVPSLDTSAANSGSSSQNSTKSMYSGGLPIQPELSPALGVGGFLLLVSGAALALIGIRKRWLYISLSTAFLAALGVTVLIEYVMNPPVTNAVQGGYLVAIVVTGAVFGGLALVFKEITEGLCCLLGGFCIGMWLMTVKAGGLVTENGAIVGFIIAFAAGFYCLSFSHYTRSYGSMVCTAFAGATALVLGIDCFSRAGLKEFWLYVWGLNDNMFPLNTNTYPVTRNIRVELAIIIIVTVFGVIAQMRLWKVIKERRATEENSRKEEERKKEEADAEAGRQLEEKNHQERAEWEQMYGNGSTKEPSMTETAVAEDSRRGSDGFNSSNNGTVHSIEMKEMASPDPHRGNTEGENTLDVVDEATSETPEGGEGDQALKAEEDCKNQQDNETTNTHGDAERDSHSIKVSRPATPPPEKAFHVNANARDDESENGAIMGSEAGTPRSKRFSGSSFKNRLSWRSGNGVKVNHQSQSEEALIAHDDATSSVAGVVDDIQTLSSRRSSLASQTRIDEDDSKQESELTMKQLPQKNILEEPSSNNVDFRSDHEVQQADNSPGIASAKDEKDEKHTVISKANVTPKLDQSSVSNEIPVPQTEENETLKEKPETSKEVKGVQRDQTMSEELKKPFNEVQQHDISSKETCPEKQPEASTETTGKRQDTQEPNESEEEKKSQVVAAEKSEDVSATKENEEEPKSDIKSRQKTANTPQPAPVKKLDKPKLDMSTVNRIPAQTSKVIHTFRTNEWAKHLADAETPELEPLEFENEGPMEQPNESARVEEAAAPVNVEELLQTPLNANPRPAVTSPAENLAFSAEEEARRRSRLSMAPIADIPNSKARNSSHRMSGARSPPISRNVSSSSLLPPQNEVHDGLGPLRSPSAPLLTLTTPSNTQDLEKERSESSKWSGPPPLLAVRENMMRNRMSSTSLRYDPWASRSASRLSLGEQGRVVSPPLSIPDEGDEQSPVHDEDNVPLSKRRAMLQRQTMESPSATSLQGFERTWSPPTSPANPGKPAAAMAAWRQSMREDISQRRDPLSLNPASPTSPDRPQSLWGSVQQMKDASSARVGDAIAEGMQRGSMTDLHRQAMRRMQASANRKL
ncbi:hypothetical protein VI817_008609 [Penicillium citrinum]|nr:hypothetical protein VI817_008609 [Penicillium citrinum]